MQQATTMTPRKVAIFDFDGTIVDGQSGALFTTYLLRHGIMRLPRALHLGWWGLRYKLHLPYRQSEARELVFGALADLDPSTVDEVMHRFHDEVLLPALPGQGPRGGRPPPRGGLRDPAGLGHLQGHGRRGRPARLAWTPPWPP